MHSERQLMSLLSINLVDVVKKLAADIGLDALTVQYVLKRYHAEGIRFLTATLPRLSKSVLRSLELGYFDRPTQFAWKGKSLRYFRSFLCAIFDESGAVRADACAWSIGCIRQFCEYFYKLSLEFDEAQLRQAESKYEDVEGELSRSSGSDPFIRLLKKNVETYYGLSGSKVEDVFQRSLPRFGPGAFFGSENLRIPFSVAKSRPDSEIGTCRIDQKPFSGYFKPYPSSPEPIKLVEEGFCSKVLFVPKDSRGPRVISKEPMHLLRSQLAFFDWLSEKLEYSTRRRINFADQEINRGLAKMGSIDRSWSTLDLKDASDRVSLRLCRYVFTDIPAVRYFISRLRSTHAELPSGKVVRLKKLAGMGSGLTFPILALLVHASVCTRVVQRTGKPMNEIMGRVYVYGDDLIVPRDWFGYAIEGLHLCELRVNADKSFHQGHFRESCGGDYYKGVDVTPVRLRWSGAGLGRPEEYRNSPEVKIGRVHFDNAVLQLERHCRELRLNGLVDLAEYYYSRIERCLGVLPLVSGDSAVLGRYTSIKAFVPVEETTRAYVPQPVTVQDPKSSPYKFLSTFFKRVRESDWIRIFQPERACVFGEIAVPRRIKIRKRLVGYIDRIISA